MNQALFNIMLNQVVKLLKDCRLFKNSVPNLQKRQVIVRNVRTLKEYKSFYDSIIAANEYDLLLNDDSFFQFDYIKGSKEPDYCRYVFMQNPKGSLISFDSYQQKFDPNNEIPIDELYEFYNNDDEAWEKLDNCFPLYIRYDADTKGYKINCHSYAHLHIGVSDMRIPSNRILSPLSFVILALKMVYYEEWESLVDRGGYQQYQSHKSQSQIITNGFWDKKEENDLFIG